jgi:hypothetical protein
MSDIAIFQQQPQGYVSPTSYSTLTHKDNIADHKRTES